MGDEVSPVKHIHLKTGKGNRHADEATLQQVRLTSDALAAVVLFLVCQVYQCVVGGGVLVGRWVVASILSSFCRRPHVAAVVAVLCSQQFSLGHPLSLELAAPSLTSSLRCDCDGDRSATRCCPRPSARWSSPTTPTSTRTPRSRRSASRSA
eukprot:1042663-Rhodomonas_salina.1